MNDLRKRNRSAHEDSPALGQHRQSTAAAGLIGAMVLAVFALGGLTGCVPRQSGGAPESYQKAKSGYVLRFGDDFRRGMNRVDELGISIAIAVDASGSMSNEPASGGDPKYIQAAAALQAVADYLETLAAAKGDMKLKVALIRFSGSVSTVMPLTELDTAGILLLRSACVPDNFLPQGGTAIGLAMERGAEILAQSGTIFNSLIVITDGENTINPEPDEVMKSIYSNNNDKSTADNPIRTDTQLISVIGFDINSPKFIKLRDLGARLSSAGNREELGAGLKDLLEADITKLE